MVYRIRDEERDIMLRAMDSAVAGLRSHQNKMDVVGHNIANVNTFGFKAQTYTFEEAMYQTATSSTKAQSNAGGVNAAQYGYGTLMGSIGMDMTASTPSYVGGFNASIDGEGFFITAKSKLGMSGDAPAGVASNLFKNFDFDYTRVGQFLLDSDGYVVDASGNYVYGFRAETDVVEGDGGSKVAVTTGYEKNLKPLRVPLATATGGVLDSVKVSDTAGSTQASASVNIQINNVGEVTATIKFTVPGKEILDDKGDPTGKFEPDTMESANVSLGKVAIATFQNPNGVTKAGGNYYKATDKDNTGLGVAAAPGDAGSATLMGGFIEASNVDLAKEFADMITTHRGFQANSKMITVSDEMLSDLVAMKR